MGCTEEPRSAALRIPHARKAFDSDRGKGSVAGIALLVEVELCKVDGKTLQSFGNPRFVDSDFPCQHAF